MPEKNRDLHGSAPDKSDTAVLLIDVINDLDFPGSEQLVEFAKPMAERIVQLKRRAKQAGVPCIYVNDNFGRWQSNFPAHVEHCLKHDVPGRTMVELLQPEEDDYFVLKPKHSGFYSTSLDVLLDYLHVQRLVIAGVAGNICVLFTANDAYMRDFHLCVPADCTASNTEAENRAALELMRTILKADVRRSEEIEFGGVVDRRNPSSGV